MSEDIELSATKKKFDVYYDKQILPVLKKLEQKRKKMLHIFCLIVPFVVLWMLFALNKMMQLYTQENDNIGAVYGLTLCLAVLAACWPMFSYYHESKESLLPLLAGFFGKFSYGTQSNISKQTLQYSKIIKPYDSFQTDDCFTGMYENIPISITEYALYQRKTVHSNGKVRTVTVKTGGGILFNAKMNKNFNGQTIVVKDKGLFNHFVGYKNLNRVGLESPEFEKTYETYSDNQIEARYILTTVMMEYMLQLKKIFPQITFSFFNQEIYINIETHKNLFECNSFFRSLINKKRIDKTFEEFYYLFAIIKILHLNQQRLL